MSSSRPTRFPRASSTRVIPTSDQLLETARARRRQRGGRGLVVLLPERVADRRAVARPRHPRPPRRPAAHAAWSDVLVCPVGFVSDHLEIRWDIDTRGEGARRASSACGSTGSRCRTTTRASSRVLAGIVRGALAAVARDRDSRPGRIVVDRVSRTFRVYPKAQRTLKDVFVARGRQRRARGVGAARRLADGRAGRGGRPRRSQRLRQDDAAAPHLRDHQADVRPRRGRRARSRRCSSSAPASTRTSPAARTST